MDVIIKETGERKTLTIIDARTGMEFTENFVLNYDNESFDTVPDNPHVLSCDKAVFDWWEAHLAEMQQVEDRIQEMREKHGFSTIDRALSEIHFTDLEELPKIINETLDCFD